MCLKEIGFHVQNMLTILGSIINIFGGDLEDHLMSKRIFTLMMNKMFISSKSYEANGSMICYSSCTNQVSY